MEKLSRTTSASSTKEKNKNSNLEIRDINNYVLMEEC
jgi:hypothetical protein